MLTSLNTLVGSSILFPKKTPISPPANLYIYDITETTISIQYDYVADADNYVITTSPATTTVNTSSNSYTFTGLSIGVEYTIYVRAQSTLKNSISAPATITDTTGVKTMVNVNATAYADVGTNTMFLFNGTSGYYQFGNIISANGISMRMLAVGGGGGGGAGFDSGGGGGGGGVVDANFLIQGNNVVDINIGAGGVGGDYGIVDTLGSGGSCGGNTSVSFGTNVNGLSVKFQETVVSPVQDINNNNYTATGYVNPIQNGIYDVSSSSFSSIEGSPYFAFDGSNATWWMSNYYGNNGSGYTQSQYSVSGDYVGGGAGNFFTTTTNQGTISGEWIQLKTPYNYKLQKYRIQGITPYSIPRNFYLTGSNNQTTWDVLDNKVNLMPDAQISATSFGPTNIIDATTNIAGIAVSADNTRLVVIIYGSQPRFSTFNKSTNTWSALQTFGSSANWYACTMTADGRRFLGAVYGGRIYHYTWSDVLNTYTGETAAADATNRNYSDIAVSADGSRLVIGIESSRVYVAVWDSINSRYGALQPTNDTTSLTGGYSNRPGVGISYDGTTIVYGASTIRVASWLGISSTVVSAAVAGSRYRFLPDNKTIVRMLQTGTNTCTYSYFVWNGSTISASTTITSLPTNGQSFYISGDGRVVYTGGANISSTPINYLNNTGITYSVPNYTFYNYYRIIIDSVFSSQIPQISTWDISGDIATSESIPTNVVALGGGGGGKYSLAGLYGGSGGGAGYGNTVVVSGNTLFNNLAYSGGKYVSGGASAGGGGAGTYGVDASGGLGGAGGAGYQTNITGSSLYWGGGGGGVSVAGSGTINVAPLIGPTFGTTSKYSCGVYAPSVHKLYSFPDTAGNILITDISNSTYSSITNANTYKSAVYAPNGKIYALQATTASTTNVLVLDTLNSDYQTSISGISNGSSATAWENGVLAPNGNIYFIPRTSTSTLIVNTSNDTASTSTITGLPGVNSWYGGVLGQNNKIYCAPHDSSYVLTIDTINQTANKTAIQVDTGAGKWGMGVAGPNGKVYFFPRGTGRMLAINTYSDTIDSSFALTNLAASSGALAPNGLIYCAPQNATTPFFINPMTNAITTFGSTDAATSKYLSTVIDNNGFIYGVPSVATQFLRISPSLPTISSGASGGIGGGGGGAVINYASAISGGSGGITAYTNGNAGGNVSIVPITGGGHGGLGTGGGGGGGTIKIPKIGTASVSFSTPITGINSNTYTSGGFVYESSASSYYPAGPWLPYHAFDGNSSTLWAADYIDTPLQASYDGAGKYKGLTGFSFYTTYIQGVGTISGEWLQFKFPFPFLLQSFTYGPRSTNTSQTPRVYYVVGSNDGSTWNQVYYKQVPSAAASYTETIPSPTTYYTHYRVVIPEAFAITVVYVKWDMVGTRLDPTSLVPSNRIVNFSSNGTVRGNAIFTNDCPTYTSSPIPLTSVKQKSMYFDGTTYIDLGNPTQNAFNTGTYECTFKVPANGSGLRALMAKSGVYGIYLDTQNRLSVGYYNGGGLRVIGFTDASFVNDNNWHHAAITFVQNNIMNLYLDGFLKGTSTLQLTNYSLLLNGTNQSGTTVASSYSYSQGTIEVWIKNVGTITGYQYIAGMHNIYAVYLYNNYLATYDNGNGVLRQSTTLITDGQWHHIALVFNNGGGNVSKLYYDGKPVLTDFTVTSIGTNTIFTIGRNTQSSQYFSGYIDEVRVWNVIRSDSEILANYNVGLLSSTTPGLAAYWIFNENTGSSVANQISGGLALILENSPTWSTGRTIYANPLQLVPLQIGADNSANLFTGSIANARVWNTVLTDTDISQNKFRVLRNCDISLNGGLHGSYLLNDESSNVLNIAPRIGGYGGSGAVVVSVPKTNIFKKVNYGLVFGASTGAIECSGLSGEFVMSSGTIDCCIKTADAGAGLRALVVKPNAYGIYLNDGVVGAYDWSTSSFITTSTNVSDNRWHHIRMVFNDRVANGSVIYVDKVLKATFTYTLLNQTGILGIRNNTSDLNQGYLGRIYNVRIWNYVKTDFTGYMSLSLSPEMGLVGSWPLNEGNVAGITSTVYNYAAIGAANPATMPADTDFSWNAIGAGDYAPTQLSVVNIEETTATLNFQINGYAVSYDITTVPTTSTWNITNNTFQFAGLTAGTAYTVKVYGVDKYGQRSSVAETSFKTFSNTTYYYKFDVGDFSNNLGIVNYKSGTGVYDASLSIVATGSTVINNVPAENLVSPVQGINANNFTATTYTNLAQNGVYDVSASSSLSGGISNIYYAFDGITTTSWTTDGSGSNGYTQEPYDPSGNYVGGGAGKFWTTTTTNAGTISGEYLQIKTPFDYRMKKYTIRTTTPYTLPYTTHITGSNDGATWKLLNTNTISTDPVLDISSTSFSAFSSYVADAIFATSTIYGIAMNGDNTRLFVAKNNAIPFYSVYNRSTATWSTMTAVSGTSRAWTGCAMSNDGNRVAAVVNGGGIYKYTWNGTTYVEQTVWDATTRNYYSVAMSGDGERVVVGVQNGLIYVGNWTVGGAFQATLDTATIAGTPGIAMINDGSAIIYGSSSAPIQTKYAVWNGSNYSVPTATTSSYGGNRYFFFPDNNRFIVDGKYATWDGTAFGSASTYALSGTPYSLYLAKDGGSIYYGNTGNWYRSIITALNTPPTYTLSSIPDYYNYYRIIIGNTYPARSIVNIINLDISGTIYEPIRNDIYQVGNGSLNLAKNTPGYVSLPSFTTTLTGFSTALWVRGPVDASNAAVFDFGQADASNAISVRFASGVPRLYMNQNNTSYTYDIGSTSLVDNSWNHIAWSIAPSGVWTAYLNGLAMPATGVSAYPNIVSRVANYIGKYITDTTNANLSAIFVDDFRSFNTAIDSTQVANLYYGKTFVQGLQPINLTVLEITVNPSITLSFTGNPNVVSYEILTSPPTQKWTTTNTTITLTGLANSTTYTLYVYGLNAFGDRSLPATLSVTMFDAPQYYYKFDSGDISSNGILLANYTTGHPVYDTSLNASDILTTTNIGMNANTYSFTDPVNTYRSGTYDASASSFATGSDPYYAFDDNATTSNLSPDYSIYFEPSGQFAQLSSSSLYNISTGTIEAWVRIPATGAGAFRGVVVKQNAYGLFVDGNVLKTYNWTNDTMPAGSVLLNDNNWHHVAFRFNNTDSRFFVDGIPTGTTFTYNISNQNGTLTIGADSLYSPGVGFKVITGYISNVRIWNTARTDAEILSNYNRILDAANTPGLIGYWRMNENTGTILYNSVPSSPNFTLNRSDTWNSSAPLMIDSFGMWQSKSYVQTNYSVLFNGTNQYGRLSDANYYNYNVGTIETWINTTNAGSSYRGIILKQFAYGLFLKDNVLIAYDWSGSGGGDRTTNVSLNTGTWRHVALTFNAGVINGSKIYIDGVLKTTFTYNINSQGTPMSIGAGTNDNTQVFNGYISNVRIWNIALDSTTIANNYKKALSPTTPNLTGYWRLNENTGSTLTNLITSNPYNFTLLNSPTWSTSAPTIYESANTSVIGTGTIYGEWLQIQMPYRTQMSAYTLRGRLSNATAAPSAYSIVGSIDGTSWYPIDAQPSVSYTSSVYTRTGVSATGFYDRFRIICEKSSGDVVVGIASWEISGLPLDALPAINTTDYAEGTGALQLLNTRQQYASLPSFTSSSDGISLSVWFKSGVDASNSVIFDSSGSATILSARLFKGRPTLYLQESGTEYSVSIPRTFTDNSWNHLLWKIDASGYWSTSVNGLDYNPCIRDVSATPIDLNSATITYTALPGATSYQIRTVPQTSTWTSTGLSQVITGLDATTSYRVLVSALIGTTKKSYPAETTIR